MPHQTLSVAVPKNIADDLANSVTVRYNQVYSRRPLWTIHISVDRVSFFIGAVGSVIVGYALSQYEPTHVENPYYVDTLGETGVLTDVLNDTINHPLKIIERFFVGGAIYVGIGLVAERYLHVTKPIASGLLTGLYFSYGYPATSMIKMTIGFGLFATAVETIFYFMNR